MKNFKIHLLLIFSLFLATACDEEDVLTERLLAERPLPVGNPGSLDLSTYVALGNSLTAGFMDGALYTDGQNLSYPKLLANQFQTAGVGGGTFNQPDINSVNGFNSTFSNIAAGVIAGRTELSLSLLAPVPTQGELPTAYTGDKSALNNFGVPGIVTAQLLTPLTGTPESPIENPLYTRFASAPGTSTILGDAIARNPTFFSLWIGNNDVLGYAITGGNSALLTAPTDFNTQFNAVISSLMGNTSANGVVINIPQTILAIPFFRAIPYNAIPFAANDPTLSVLNGLTAYGGFNAALDGLAAAGAISASEAASRKVVFSAGANPVVIVDDSMADLGPILSTINPALASFGQIRQIASNELVLLSAGRVLGTLADPNNPASVIGVGVPLADNFVLTVDEIGTALQSIVAFNQTMATAVASNSSRLVLYDTNSPTSTFTDLYGLSDGTVGVVENGINLLPDFSPNGVFSTDGVHPNPKGSALIANDIIRLLNDSYDASIPETSVDAVRSIIFQ